MEPNIRDRLGGPKRLVDPTDELLLLDNKLPKLDVDALQLSKLPGTPHLDESAETSTSSNEPNTVEQTSGLDLDTLPEYVLLHLFSYLNIQDLFNLCHRLQPFSNDFTTVLRLFKSINLSSCLAESHRDEYFKLSSFENLKSLPNLKSFIVDNHSLDCEMLNSARLPESLTELRLRKIDLLNLNEGRCVTFHDLHLKLPNVEMLSSFAQCSHLKKSIMVGCTGMDNIMHYAAHAADFGFSKHETLDLRLTSYVSLNEIAVFKKLKNLKHILLENAKQCKQNRPTNKSTPMPFLHLFRVKHRHLSNYINTWLETLVVRNYSCITDKTLAEIEKLFRTI